jgi:hypothetical protein
MDAWSSIFGVSFGDDTGDAAAEDHENEYLQWWNIIWAAFIKVREWDNYFYLALAI